MLWAMLLLLLILSAPAEARVTQIKIEKRERVLDGHSIGLAGPYEKLVGEVRFALDPKILQNRAIIDIDLAPRNANGEVEFSADICIIKPVDLSRANGRLFYEVPNRGQMSLLRSFHIASFQTLPPDPTSEPTYLFLMRQGFTFVWLGWQWDVPVRSDLLRMELPIATEQGRAINGLVRSQSVVSSRVQKQSLGDNYHTPYRPIDPRSAENVLTVRNLRLDAPETIPHDKWRFADDETTVTLDDGFEPGRIYEITYRSRDPRVTGCGLAGTRDIVSFIKHEQSDANPLSANGRTVMSQALGIGVSQTGRFLRHFIYQGFNEDESGRRVFDGLYIQAAGSGRGSFNHRFAQPSRAGFQHMMVFFPTFLFPFADLPQTDDEINIREGLLDRATARKVVPKIFYVNTSFEYWNAAASLLHTDPDGERDAPVPETTRVYYITGASHLPGAFPPGPFPNRDYLGAAPANPNAYAPVVRALLFALDRWVAESIAPPESRYPRIADGTLVSPAKVEFPAIPGVRLPLKLNDARRLDFGDRFGAGIVDREPPRIGKPFGVLVPAVDADGNERAGIKLPEISVPLATYTGWAYRHPSIGAATELAGVVGSYFSFAHTLAERESRLDPRPSIAERYRNRDEYVGKIAASALGLMKGGYLLAEDVPEVLAQASAHYDWATSKH